MSIRENSKPENAEIRIADNGPPIPDVETAVLDQGSELDSTYHGSGTGLWVMQWCASSLGGNLTFETNSPRGNVVCLSLPHPDSPKRER